MTSATIATAPIASVKRSGLVSPKTPEMKPLPSARYSVGNEPMFAFPSTTSASPRKMSMPASVTMKAGMPTKATQNPCHAPTSAPMSEREDHREPPG